MTEEIIKKSVIQYLKSYYKYRPRFQNDETLAPTLAQTDLMTSNGIYADGHISFLDDKSKQFVATFEASSADSAFEVRYRLEKNLLFWDAIAASALITAFVFSYIFAFRYDLIKPINGGWVFFFSLLTFLIINVIYRFSFRKMERYRSIFAIEQFKQYYADEQWVAISHDTFKAEEDHFLQELKKQCVFNGFGLLMVDSDQDVQLMITPARELVYGKKRQRVPFFTSLLENNYTQKIVSWTQATGQKVLQPIAEKSLLRFHRPYYNQWGITAMAALIFIAAMYRFMQDVDVLLTDKNDKESVMNKSELPIPEKDAVDDSLHLRPFKDQQKINSTASVDEPMPAVVPNDFTEKGAKNNEDGVFMMSESGELNFYDCERLNLEGDNYVIMDSRQPDLQHAKVKMQQLKNKGVATNCVWLGCFSRSNLSYVIFYDLIYNDKKEAAKKGVEIYALLKNKNLDASKVKIISLTNAE